MVSLRRIFVFTFVVVGLLVWWLGLSKADATKPKVIWKMGTHAPEAVGFGVYMEKTYIPAIEKATNDEIGFDVYYGGTMGDDEDWIAKIRIDQLQGAGFDGHGSVMACPDLAVMELPFLFNSFAEVAYVRGNIIQRFINSFEERGYRLLSLIDQDFDQIYSTKRAIRAPEDFVKSRFVTYSGVMEYELFRAIGASPIPLNVPEIVTSIRAGIADGLIAPAIWYVGSQLYTMTKHVTPTNMRYAPACIVVSMKAWNRISEENQKAIEKVLPQIECGMNECGHDGNARCLRAMIKYGVKEVKLTPAEIEVLKKKTMPLWDKLADKQYSRGLLNEVLGHIEEYRSNR